jgi:hypothetical protein
MRNVLRIAEQEKTMVPALSLWLPILLSAVFVFIVSSVIHMVLTWWHRDDYQRLPAEDEVLKALSPLTIPPGDYFMPHLDNFKDRESEAYKEKLERGPVGMLTVIPADYQLGKKLVSWFLYSILVGLFAAYLTGRAVGPGAHYLEVFRFSGAVAFGAYSMALLQNSIWYARSWTSTLKSVLDGFIYALVTAGTFGWLWP